LPQGKSPVCPAKHSRFRKARDGYVNVREGKSVEAAVIATAKTGEPFIF
jgi:hypothetical protein